MASCGSPGSLSPHTPGAAYPPSPMPQASTSSASEVRPKIEVVKAKMRGRAAVQTRTDNDKTNGPSDGSHFPSRELDVQGGPSYSSQMKQGEVSQKRTFDQAFTGTPVSNGDDMPTVSTQLGHSDGFCNTPVNVATTTSFPANTGLMKSSASYTMEYWNGPATGSGIGQEASRPLVPSAFVHPTANMSFHGHSSDGGSTDYWIKDEKELKRQKRKEANRESARRSRMRKQAECDELAEKVQALTAENESLRLEVDRLGELCQKLSSENLVLLERLKK